MIYWDNNATTPLHPEVLEAMLPYMQAQYFNPSASYRAAKRVRDALEDARAAVATLVGAEASEIIFTSGGTEASNTALHQFKHPLISAIEHPASLQFFAEDARTLAPVTADGLIDAEQWLRLLPGHDGVSFALANHETGVIQDAARLAGAAVEAGARVHLDIVQAAAKMPVDLASMPIHFASLSAHKLHGPKGVGALYVRRGTAWKPYLRGGDQESALRAGTENVAGIIGFAKAAELALQAAEEYKNLEALRNRFEQGLRAAGLSIIVHGGDAPRLVHVSNLRVEGFMAESLLLLLEARGILCSAGSACTSAQAHASHVLLAMGLPDKTARGALRFSLNRMSTQQDVDTAISAVAEVVERVRAAQSPLTGPVMVYKPSM